jgi:hypothetical protein
MRAIKATIYTVIFFAIIAGMTYGAIHRRWFLLALFGFFSFAIFAWVWAVVYERLGHL